MINRLRKRWRLFAVLVAVVAVCSGCALFSGGTSVIVRSDPSLVGFTYASKYNIVKQGDSVANLIKGRGMGPVSPMPATATSYDEAAGLVSQDLLLTDPNGAQISALGMDRATLGFGLSRYLKAYVTTYEQRDKDGNRVCGAKVRLTWQPLLAQAILHDQYRRAWDALFYYSVPCAPQNDQPMATLDLSHAKFLALVIDQQFTPRITFDGPVLFNRGHSVTVVGGPPSHFVGGWWLNNVGILNAADLVVGMVKALDQHEWLSFGGAFSGAGLVYSAGDADVYASAARFFLDRQSDYLVHFRASPNVPWRQVLIHPRYNIEWNDMSQQWTALTNTDWPAQDDLVDKTTGRPKSLNPNDDAGEKLKEIETAGCQGCPNATLEQVEFLDPVTHQPLYAVTFRGYLGSSRSLVLFGRVPGSVSTYQREAAAADSGAHYTACPIQTNSDGTAKDSDHQFTKQTCADWLAEGGLFNFLTTNPANSGSDEVIQYSVEDNSAWASRCDNGNPVTCVDFLVTPRFDASYMFTNTGAGLQKAWTVLQLLGEVGMRTLGFSYASGPYEGSGLDFAMAQPGVDNAYFAGVTAKAGYNPEGVFRLDARALQLPQTLQEAGQILYGPPN